MVYIVYGSDLVQSRRFIGFIKAKSGSSQIKTVYAKKDFNFKDFQTIVSSTSLFSESVLTIVEFDKTPNINEIKHLTFLENLQDSTNVILWVGENLNKTHLLLKYAQARKNLITSKAFNKKDSTLNFELVDMLNIKNPKAFLVLNKILTKDSEASLILATLATNFRNILGYKLESAFVKGLHPYVKMKVGKASEFFSEWELANILKEIYETDVRTKSNTKDTKSSMFSLICNILGLKMLE